MNLYVTYTLEKEGGKSVHRIGQPLKFHAFDRPSDVLPAARVLLGSGADPNEVCEGKTPWVFMLTHCNMIKPSDTDIVRPMLNSGVDPLEIVLRDGSGWWMAHQKHVHHTTAFHVALPHLESIKDSKKTGTTKDSLGHCKRFDAVDSEGVGIVEWADTARAVGSWSHG